MFPERETEGYIVKPFQIRGHGFKKPERKYLKGRKFSGKKFWRFDQSAKLIVIWRNLFWRITKRSKFG